MNADKRNEKSKRNEQEDMFIGIGHKRKEKVYFSRRCSVVVVGGDRNGTVYRCIVLPRESEFISDPDFHPARVFLCVYSGYWNGATTYAQSMNLNISIRSKTENSSVVCRNSCMCDVPCTTI